ncbi:MAG: helix-turn-helix domain-containing protein [Oscillospiraceae bacterium]|jgi:AraC-like DNA-binding protein|nr:helix-turn-helix domain-containing protein [Oscillospiraceae bacterium]
MNINTELSKMNLLTPPLQPGINCAAKLYRESVECWNSASLKDRALFYQFSTGDFDTDTVVVPDACMNILIKCGTDYSQARVYGLFSEPQTIKLEPNSTYFGIKPYSNTGIHEDKMRLKDLRNQGVELGCLFANSERFLERLCEKENFKERVALFKEYASREIIDYEYQTGVVDYFTVLSCVADGDKQYRDFVGQIGYSDRYFRACFNEVFGIAPKVYTCIMRFQHVLRDYISRGNMDDDVYLDYGYYDQAHFIKEFRRFTFMSPKQYLNMCRREMLINGSS